MAEAPKLTLKFKINGDGVDMARRTLEAAAEELRACGVDDDVIESAIRAAIQLVTEDLVWFEIEETMP